MGFEVYWTGDFTPSAMKMRNRGVILNKYTTGFSASLLFLCYNAPRGNRFSLDCPLPIPVRFPRLPKTGAIYGDRPM
jgi:hypothetical protein